MAFLIKNEKEASQANSEEKLKKNKGKWQQYMKELSGALPIPNLKKLKKGTTLKKSLNSLNSLKKFPFWK